LEKCRHEGLWFSFKEIKKNKRYSIKERIKREKERQTVGPLRIKMC
jgi:hypothetical protein